MSLRIATTDSQLHALESIAHGKLRKGTTAVAVDLAALRNLLADHSTLLLAATTRASRGGMGHKVEAGADQESLQ